jgi:hypothetical protein
MLVLLQGDIALFRATRIIQDKAQFAENGQVLFKDCNAELDYPGSSLRASREALARGVAPPGKGGPFPARLAEQGNITLKEY